MRKIWMGCAVAALVAATGCGGSAARGSASSTATDEHQGPDQVCTVCTVEGTGEIRLGDVAVPVRVDVTPDAERQLGSAPGAFWVAEKGFLVTQRTCTRERGTLRATLSGYGVGIGIVTIVVTDGGPDARGTVAVTQDAPQPGHVFDATFPATELASGDLRIAGLEQCSAPCAEGQCLCPDDHVTCEPCAPPAPATPTPPASLPK
jgi:hypothetical protein